jgi:hypothetical protein
MLTRRWLVVTLLLGVGRRNTAKETTPLVITEN